MDLLDQVTLHHFHLLKALAEELDKVEAAVVPVVLVVMDQMVMAVLVLQLLSNLQQQKLMPLVVMVVIQPLLLMHMEFMRLEREEMLYSMELEKVVVLVSL
jgi:hypothetical protein